MTDSNRALNELPALIEERRRYESWLAALEARRGSTKPHVFERVQQDYRSRLQQVDDKLIAYRDTLGEKRSSVVARLSDLGGEQQLRRDERAELELRVEIGELTAADAADSLRALDDVLKRLDDQKAEVQRNIAILDELLGGGTKPQASATRRQPSRVSTATEEPRPSTPGGTFDELAFLSSVIGADGKPIEEQPMPPATAARPPYGAEIPATDLPHVGQPDPEPERSVMSGVRGSAAEILRERSMSEALLAGLSEPPTGAGAQHPLAAESDSAPIVLRTSGATEHPKSLKCTECGALNYPTEWYCERCGAELAAL